MQRSLSAPADTFVSPYRSKPPLSAPPTSASAEYLLAEQLLRARSSSSSGSQMSAGHGHGQSAGGLFSTATLANSSMQSSCSAVALARSSYTLGALTACPSTSSSRQSVSASRSTGFGSGPPARSASSGTISVPGSKGRCIGAAASCFRMLRSSDPSFPVRLGSFTVQVRPLEQIVQKANSITEGRPTRTYEFP